MRVPFTGKRRLIALLAVLAVVGVACGDPVGPQDFLARQSGSNAESADSLWDITFAIAAVIFVIVEGLIVYALIKFRQRPGVEAKQFHGNVKVEIILTVIPSLILAGLAVPTVQTIFENSKRPEGAVNISVTAKQFWWEYNYGDLGVVTANELHLPVDQPAYIEVTAATNDVVHSFWIPQLAGAQDAVPGRTNIVITTPTEEGVYWGQCKEFCGLSHSRMRLRVIVESQDEFEAWVADQKADAAEPTESLAQQGAELFVNGQCAGCHTIRGTNALGTTGPDLTHLMSRETFAGAIFEMDEGNLRAWVNDAPAQKPGSIMPAFDTMGFQPGDLDAIIAYLMTLE
jgi:cytochrome c oxidase subunit 2